jgi:hypothetical protein
MEGSQINDLPEPSEQAPTGNGLINSGAVIAVLLGIPCFFIGVYGIAGVVTGGKLAAGFLGVVWSYLAVAGAYELNRRKFNWSRGSRHSDWHLFAGTAAVSFGLVVSGAIHETMPILAIVPALSAMKQANDGHENKHRSWFHAAALTAGLGVGFWFYKDGIIGQVMMEKIVALP